MAKKMDMTKLDRIREASVEIISEHGILNSSVASIAERAGVSVGYLYRHYPGKVDLIEDALRTITDRIYALADETNDIRKIVRGIVEFIIESAATNRPKHKFLIMLLNDFSVEINPDIRERIRSIGDTLIAVGRKNNVLRDDTSVEDLYIALVGIPMQYLASRYKFGFGDETDDQRRLIEKITAISLSAIQ